MKTPVILITGQSKFFNQVFKARMPYNGFRIINSPPQTRPNKVIQECQPDLILLGAENHNCHDELDFARRVRKQDSRIPIIFVTRHSSETLAIAALKAGVNEYLKTPLSHKELLKSIHKKLSPAPYSSEPKCSIQAKDKETHHAIVGTSRAMLKVKQNLAKVARSDCKVLITGETGTGKELAAHAIHCTSNRKDKPLVCINCAAIPDSLVESELFGYEQGAFTGAVSSKKGLFESASDGTVFLDEIGDMTPFAQAKILRCIELKESNRLGSRTGIPLDFRVIAATNRDPEALIAQNMFRKDLYYRLKVAQIHLPPLRERKEDLPDLVDHFIEQFNKQFRRRIIGFTSDAFQALIQYDWPGNVRELRNLVEVSFINLSSHNVEFMELPYKLKTRVNEIKNLPESERDQIIATLCETKWNKSKAAEKLNWSRMTLYRKIAKYNIISSPNPI